MKYYLSENEFVEMRQRLQSGEASLTVAASVARQFFTRVSNASIEETTGRSMMLQKLAVFSGIVVATLLLLAGLGLVIYSFGWGAAILVPLLGIFWTVLAGFTGDRGNWIHTVVGLVVGVGLGLLVDDAYGTPLILLTVSLCIHRSTYQLAQYFVVDLVSTSFPAYDMMVEHIVLRDPALAKTRKQAA